MLIVYFTYSGKKKYLVWYEKYVGLLHSFVKKCALIFI